VSQELEALRAEHGVRLVTEEEEGFGIAKVPPGVYGFSYAPSTEEIPLFCKKTFQSFEVHKLADGSEHLIGFVTPKEAIDLEMGNKAAEIRLYPEPVAEAVRLVSVNLAIVIPNKKGPARSDGNFLSLRLA
jgi:hypothetical protein